MSLLKVNWTKTTLGEVAKWSSGGTPKRTNNDYYGGSIPWVKTGDLGDRVLNQSSEFITEEGLKNSSAKLFPKGSLGLAMYGATIGKVSIFGIEAACNQACAVAVPDYEKIHTDFLYYLLKNEKEAFIKKGKGGAQPNISQTIIKAHEIAIPSIEEQKRIADKLDSVLAKVEAAQTRLDKIPAILKRFRQSVLAAATSGELTRKFRQDSLVQNEIMDDYFAPKEWKVTDFNSLTHFITSGSRGWAKYYSHSGDIFIRAQNINGDSLNLEDVAYVSLPDRVEGRRTKVEIDDLLITITGANVTKTARVSQKIGEAYVSQHVALVKLKDKSISKFIEIFLKSESAGRGSLGKLAYGGGKPGLNLQNIKSLRVAIPDKNEMVAINEKVEQLTALAEKTEKQYDAAKSQLDKLTQSILVKAFKGELLHTEVENEFLQELSDVEAVEC
jgi:type I restriction enzyme S subunit